MHSKKTFTLKKLVLALAIAGYTMSSAYAVLTGSTGSIQGRVPVLNAPSTPNIEHSVDLSSNLAGTTLATGDTITLTYDYTDLDGDADNSTAHVQWYYVNGGVDTAIAATNVLNTSATSQASGTSVLTIPGVAIGAEAIKVVIQEYSLTGDPIAGQTITVDDASPSGPIVPGGGVTPGIYLSTDLAFANNLIGTSTPLTVGQSYVFKLWDDTGVGTVDLTSSVTYNWRLVGTSATDNITAPANGFVTSVNGPNNFTVPVNSAADGKPLTGSDDGAQGFNLAVDYN